MYELVVGASMLNAGYEHVLIVGAETLSAHHRPDDRGTRRSSSATAPAPPCSRAPTGDEPASSPGTSVATVRPAALLEIPAGGSRRPRRARPCRARALHEDAGPGSLPARGARGRRLGDATLERAGVDASDVDWFVPHQANIRIIDAAAKRLGIPTERTVVNIERYGNTSSASIPLALFEAVEDGRVRDGDLVLLLGLRRRHDVGERAHPLGRRM